MSVIESTPAGDNKSRPEKFTGHPKIQDVAQRFGQTLAEARGIFCVRRSGICILNFDAMKAPPNFSAEYTVCYREVFARNSAYMRTLDIRATC